MQCVLVIRESFTKEYGSRVFLSSPCGPLFLHIEPNHLSLVTRTHCSLTASSVNKMSACSVNSVELSILRPRMEKCTKFPSCRHRGVRAAFLKEKFPFPFVSRPDTICQWRSPIGVSPALHVDASSALLQPAPDLAISQ